MKLVGPLLIAAALLPLAVRAQAVPDAAEGAANVADIAGAGAEPYASIVARNMFGLVPIPPPDPDAGKPPVEPPPKITPTGIMTIFGRLQALFKVATKAKLGQPAKDNAFVLAEGERQDDIEVVKIDQPNRTITFNNHGKVEELPLVAAKDTGGPAAGSGGGSGPGNPGLGIPRPSPTVDRATLMRNRQAARTGNTGNATPENNAPGLANPGTTASKFGGDVNERGIYQPSAGSGLSPEENAILMEAQRMKYQQEGSPMAPLMPPPSKAMQGAIDAVNKGQ